MRTMLILIMVSLSCPILSGQTPASVMPTCPTLEVGIVAERSDAAVRRISSASGVVISLTEKPLLTIRDFTDANVSVTEGQVVLNLSMTTESAKRVREFTANNVVKMIAFLVNGLVIKTPKIVDPITGKGFLIGPFEPDEAQKLADSINHRAIGC
jgi:preprotein translocase subunit SecD